jgi:hypothetical protein
MTIPHELAHLSPGDILQHNHYPDYRYLIINIRDSYFEVAFMQYTHRARQDIREAFTNGFNQYFVTTVWNFKDCLKDFHEYAVEPGTLVSEYIL